MNDKDEKHLKNKCHFEKPMHLRASVIASYTHVFTAWVMTPCCGGPVLLHSGNIEVSISSVTPMKTSQISYTYP